MSSVKEVFSEDLLISGRLQFAELESDTNMLTVYVYHYMFITQKQGQISSLGISREGENGTIL